MQVCPSCDVEWPDDRFNGRHAECFKCRAGTVGVSFGNIGRQVFHDTTVKEFNDRQVREAKKNGMDVVPARSAAVSLAGATLKKLESRV